MSCTRNRRMFVLRGLIAMGFWLFAPAAYAQGFSDTTNWPAPQPQTLRDVNRAVNSSNDELSHPGSISSRSDSQIGSDDLLDISVFEAPEMNRTIRVSTSGEISFELLGAVHAAGLTPRELESVLQEMLSKTYLKDPHVGVFVREWHSHSVSVMGAVKSPGVFQIEGTKSLLEVLSMAQGLADDAGSAVLITHATRPIESGSSSSSSPSPATTEEINLRKLLSSPDSQQLNVPIRSGDVLKVPRAGIVYVVGEVNRPGGFVLQNSENISVLQAIALAQGLTHTSAVGRARIIRTDEATGKRAEIPLNLGKILAGKSTDPILEAKDVVFVPNSTTKSVLYRGSEAAVQTAAGVAIYKW